MGNAFLHGNGGAGGGGLNFKIKAYASVDDLPATAKENSIAVITDNPITYWIMSDIEPVSVVAENVVWIQTGTDSDVAFNAIKKNMFFARPMNVYQYIDGEFENKEAWIYRGNSWIQFSNEYLYVFNEGKDARYTDGWTYTADSYANGSGSVSNVIYLYSGKPSSGAPYVHLTMNGSIDVSGYTKMYIEWGSSGMSSPSGDSRSIPNYQIYNGSTTFVSDADSKRAPSGITSYNISSATTLKLKFSAGTNYLGGDGTNVTLQIKKIWLTKE